MYFDQEADAHMMMMADAEREADELHRPEAEGIVQAEANESCRCGRDAFGLECEQCGVAVCTPCADSRSGFCAEHPDAEYLPYESVEDW